MVKFPWSKPNTSIDSELFQMYQTFAQYPLQFEIESDVDELHPITYLAPSGYLAHTAFILKWYQHRFGGMKLPPPQYFILDDEYTDFDDERINFHTHIKETTTLEKLRHELIYSDNHAKPFLRPLIALENRDGHSIRAWALKPSCYSEVGNSYYDSNHLIQVSKPMQDVVLNEPFSALTIRNHAMQQDTSEVFSEILNYPDTHRTVFANTKLQNPEPVPGLSASYMMTGTYTFEPHKNYPLYGSEYAESYKDLLIPAKDLIHHPDYLFYKLLWPIFDWESLERPAFVSTQIPTSL